MRAAAIAVGCLALCGCPGTSDLRAPGSLPKAGMTISIYRDRDNRVPTTTPVGPVTTSAGYGGGYRPTPTTGITAATPTKSMALVIDRRWMELVRGEQEIRLLGVAATLDASSTWVQSLSDPSGTALLAQRYEGATVSPDALLEKHVGHDIEITTAKGPVSGRLLGYSVSEITLVDDKGSVRTLPRQTAISSIGLGDDRSLGEPALRPTLRVETAGKHLLEVAYEAKGLNWWVDYGVEVGGVKPGDAVLALSSRATVKNDSGMDIDNAAISLYAGTLGTKAGKEAAKVWTGRGSIARGQATQFQIRREVRDMAGRIELVYNGAIPDTSKADKEQYFGTQSHGQVRRTVAFDNSKELGLGGVLPAGRAMITMSRGAGVPPERHESHLRERVEVGDTARMDIGPVQYVTGQRRQVFVDRSADGKRVTERYEIELRNHTDQELTVRVIEDLVRSGTPSVRKLDPEPSVRDERRLEFVLELEPRGRATATFEATYRW